jgi:hypothetical protein
MAANPCMVTADIVITWDGVSQRVARGTIVDVPPGSALEAAYSNGANPVYTAGYGYFYGDSNLAALSPWQAGSTEPESG